MLWYFIAVVMIGEINKNSNFTRSTKHKSIEYLVDLTSTIDQNVHSFAIDQESNFSPARIDRIEWAKIPTLINENSQIKRTYSQTDETHLFIIKNNEKKKKIISQRKKKGRNSNYDLLSFRGNPPLLSSYDAAGVSRWHNERSISLTRADDSIESHRFDPSQLPSNTDSPLSHLLQRFSTVNQPRLASSTAISSRVTFHVEIKASPF